MPKLANRQIRLRPWYANELAPRWYWPAGEPAPSYKPWEHKATLAQWNDINWTLGMVSKIVGLPRHGFSSPCVALASVMVEFLASVARLMHVCLAVLGADLGSQGLPGPPWMSSSPPATVEGLHRGQGSSLMFLKSPVSSLEMIPLHNPLAALLPKQLFSASWDVCLTFILAWYKECMWG